MAFFDYPLDKLRTYRPELSVPDDLQSFWETTLAQARRAGGSVRAELIDNRLRLIDTYDVTFPGYDGSPVKAWLHVPAGQREPLPTIATFIGYRGGRGFPFANTVYAQAGWAQLIMDTRAQSFNGGGWETTDDVIDGPLPSQYPGQMTRGITDPATYYYRRVYTDALRMLDAAAELPQCDPGALVVAGGSQGGGISIAAAGIAALTGTRLAGAVVDVPFLCDFPRALTLTNAAPYSEISSYLANFRDHRDTVLRTLSYFDGAVLGRWAEVPTTFSIALMDQTCPPSTCFAAYNAWGEGKVTDADKDLQLYEYNGHEGGGDYRRQQTLDWLHELLD